MTETYHPQPVKTVRRRGTYIESMVVTLFGAAVASQALALGLTNSGSPGPGLWPMAVACLLILFGLLMLLQPPERESVEAVHPTAPRTRRVIEGIVAVAAFILLFQYAGFIVALFLSLLFWLRRIARESWLLTIVISIGTTVVLYLGFVVFLNVQFPITPLF